MRNYSVDDNTQVTAAALRRHVSILSGVLFTARAFIGWNNSQAELPRLGVQSSHKTSAVCSLCVCMHLGRTRNTKDKMWPRDIFRLSRGRFQRLYDLTSTYDLTLMVWMSVRPSVFSVQNRLQWCAELYRSNGIFWWALFTAPKILTIFCHSLGFLFFFKKTKSYLCT